MKAFRPVNVYEQASKLRCGAVDARRIIVGRPVDVLADRILGTTLGGRAFSSSKMDVCCFPDMLL